MKTILLYLLVSTRFLFAQLSERDTSFASYVATVQGSLSSGNVERTLVFGSIDIASKFSNLGISTENTYVYGSVSGKTTENDWFSKNFIYYAPEEILYPYVMFWWEANKRKQIESRYQIGAGGTYVYRPHKHHTLKTSLTLSYEQSDYTVALFNNSKFNGSDKMSDEKLTLRTFYTAKIAQHLTL